jgi:hypothetical protein
MNNAGVLKQYFIGRSQYFQTKHFVFILYFYFFILMKNLKKVLAFMLMFVMILWTVVHATNAPLDNATAVVVLGGDGSNDSLTGTLSTKDFSWDNVGSYVIKKNDGTIVYSGSSVDTNANWSFVISGVDFDANNVDVSNRYTISFVTASWDYGAAVLVVNKDTYKSNELTVTGAVLPVLKFAIEDADRAMWFGILTSTYTWVTTGLEVGTNAVNWLTITAKSTNWGLNSSNASHTIGLSGNDALYSDENYQFKTVTWAHDSVSDATITKIDFTTVNDTSAITVYTADKPQNFNITNYDVDFTAQIKIAESTPAATDYTDNIIFTVTGNF